MSLMRSVAREHRALQLHRAYKLAWRHDIHGVPLLQSSVSGHFPGPLIFDPLTARSRAIQILCQTFHLPWHIYDRIVSFIPLPRLWHSTLRRLCLQRHANSDEVFRAAMEIVDEGLNDILQIPLPSPSLHLVAIAMQPGLQSFLMDDMKMHPHLLKLVIDWSDTQSQCSRLSDSDVTFLPPAAEKMLKLAKEIVRWHDAIEYGMPYNFDAEVMTEAIHLGDEEDHSLTNVEMQHEVDSGSSDGEMDI